MKTVEDALDALERIFNYCEEIDNNIPKDERTGYNMLPDVFVIQEVLTNCQLTSRKNENKKHSNVQEYKVFEANEELNIGVKDNKVILKYLIKMIKEEKLVQITESATHKKFIGKIESITINHAGIEISKDEDGNIMLQLINKESSELYQGSSNFIIKLDNGLLFISFAIENITEVN